MQYNKEQTVKIINDFYNLIKVATQRINQREELRGNYHNYDEDDFDCFNSDSIDFHAVIDSGCNCCSNNHEHASITFDELHMSDEDFNKNIVEKLEKQRLAKEAEQRACQLRQQEEKERNERKLLKELKEKYKD